MRKPSSALVDSRHVPALACLTAGALALLAQEPRAAIACFVLTLACALGASIAKSLCDYCDENFG